MSTPSRPISKTLASVALHDCATGSLYYPHFTLPGESENVDLLYLLDMQFTTAHSVLVMVEVHSSPNKGYFQAASADMDDS